jgi:uncharacterized membrane protein
MTESGIWIIEQAPIEKSENWLIQTANTRVNIGAAIDLNHARLFAVAPRMLEALEAAREYVSNTTTDCRECGEPNSSSSRDKTIRIIDATIAAAKGK